MGNRLLNLDDPYAKDDGRLELELAEGLGSVRLEWAPADTPLGFPYPFVTNYALDVGPMGRLGVARRLCNFGLAHKDLTDRVRAFQMLYRLAPTGRWQDVVPILADFYDLLGLQEVPELGADEPYEFDLTAQNQRSNAEATQTRSAFVPPGLFQPHAPPVTPPAAGGNTTPVPKLSTVQIRVVVRSVHAGPIDGCAISLSKFENGKSLNTRTINAQTNAQGEHTFSTDIHIVNGDRLATILAAHHHHGPVASPGQNVVAGAAGCVIKVDNNGPVSVAQPGFTGGEVVVTSTGDRHVLITLMDAGMNLGKAHESTGVRRLTPEQVREELLFHLRNGNVDLAPGTFVFKHDKNHPFAACTSSNCTITAPILDANASGAPPRGSRVLLTPSPSLHKLAGVDLVAIEQSKSHGVAQPGESPSQRFTRDHIRILRVQRIQTRLSQRLVIGLIRLLANLKSKFGVIVAYHMGFSSANNDAHQFGRAADIGGFALKRVTPPRADSNVLVRMNEDFMVHQHWGRVPMWHSTTVAANPQTSTHWTRFPDVDGQRRDPADFRNRQHTHNGQGQLIRQLQYRLEPAFAQGNPDVAPHLKKAAEIFRHAYEVAAGQFSVTTYVDNGVRTVLLGPLPTGQTAIPDPKLGDHLPADILVLHPDHPNPGQRATHFDHFHFVFGTRL